MIRTQGLSPNWNIGVMGSITPDRDAIKQLWFSRRGWIEAPIYSISRIDSQVSDYVSKYAKKDC